MPSEELDRSYEHMVNLEKDWNERRLATFIFILRCQVHGDPIKRSPAQKRGDECAFALGDVTVAGLEVHYGTPVVAGEKIWTMALTNDYSCLDAEHDLSYDEWTGTLFRVTPDCRAISCSEDLKKYPIEY